MSVEFGGIPSRLKPGKNEAPRMTEVIGGVKINHTQLPGKSEPGPTAFILQIPTTTGEKIVMPIFVGDEVGLPTGKGDTKKVSVSAPHNYPYLIGPKKENPSLFKLERHIVGINDNSHQTGVWLIDTISGKGDPGLTDHALDPINKKIRGSSYGFNNKFTELKSPIGLRVIFEPTILSEAAKPRQLFPQGSAAKASA